MFQLSPWTSLVLYDFAKLNAMKKSCRRKLFPSWVGRSLINATTAAGPTPKWDLNFFSFFAALTCSWFLIVVHAQETKFQNFIQRETATIMFPICLSFLLLLILVIIVIVCYFVSVPSPPLLFLILLVIMFISCWWILLLNPHPAKPFQTGRYCYGHTRSIIIAGSVLVIAITGTAPRFGNEHSIQVWHITIIPVPTMEINAMLRLERGKLILPQQ